MDNFSVQRYVTIDATSPVTVHINNGDIVNGVPGDPENCAIALAFRRAFRKQKGVFVRVFRTTVWVGHEGKEGEHVVELFDLDGNGRNLVASMDTTKTAYPVTVTILPRSKGRTKEAIARKNQRLLDRRAAGIPPNPKFHTNGGAKDKARTLAGIRSGSSVNPTTGRGPLPGPVAVTAP
jgi:hypothetical protein